VIIDFGSINSIHKPPDLLVVADFLFTFRQLYYGFQAAFMRHFETLYLTPKGKGVVANFDLLAKGS
jgi:hypothetical protein